MSAKNFGKLREQLEQRPGGAQALERARQSLDAEISAYEAGLAELRRARNLTQTQLARQLEVSQSEVSRIERRADLFLSTLQSYIEAMGGQLELVGVFDDARVTLSIGELVPPAGEPDEDVSEQEETPTARIWDVDTEFTYGGSLDDPAIDDLRAAILRSIWVVSDAVAVRRGRDPDLLDVGFAIEAATKDEALQRAYNAMQSASRKTSAMRPKAVLSAELAAGVG